MKQSSSKRLGRWAYCVTLVIAMGLFVGGFFVPPMGEVHPSVLYAGGMLMLFTTIYLFVVSRTNISLSADLDDKQINLNATQNE